MRNVAETHPDLRIHQKRCRRTAANAGSLFPNIHESALLINFR
jgi:hypothetical protein